MDALKNKEIYTIDDIYALPDGKRAELIDGQRIPEAFSYILKIVNSFCTCSSQDVVQYFNGTSTPCTNTF